jgi:hypothetical protein
VLHDRRSCHFCLSMQQRQYVCPCPRKLKKAKLNRDRGIRISKSQKQCCALPPPIKGFALTTGRTPRGKKVGEFLRGRLPRPTSSPNPGEGAKCVALRGPHTIAPSKELCYRSALRATVPTPHGAQDRRYRVTRSAAAAAPPSAASEEDPAELNPDPQTGRAVQGATWYGRPQKERKTAPIRTVPRTRCGGHVRGTTHPSRPWCGDR